MITMKKLSILIAALLVFAIGSFGQSIKALNSFKSMKLKVTQDYLGEVSGDHYFVSTLSKTLVVADENFRPVKTAKLPIKKKARVYSDWVKLVDDKIYISYGFAGKNYIKVVTKLGALVKDVTLKEGTSSNITDDNAFSIINNETGEVSVYKITDGVKEVYTSAAYFKNFNKAVKKEIEVTLHTNQNNTFNVVITDKKQVKIYVENYKTDEIDEEIIDLKENTNIYRDIDLLFDDKDRLVVGIFKRVENPDKKRHEDEYQGLKLYVYKTTEAGITEENIFEETFPDNMIEEWKEEYKAKRYEGIISHLMIEQVHFSEDEVYVLMNVTDLESTTTTTTGANNSTTTTTTWTRTNNAMFITQFSAEDEPNTIMIKRKTALTAGGSSIIEQRAKSCALIEREGDVYVLYNYYGTKDDYDKKERDRVIIKKLGQNLELHDYADLIVFDMVKNKYPLYIDFNILKQEGNKYWFYGIFNLIRSDGAVVELTFD